MPKLVAIRHPLALQQTARIPRIGGPGFFGLIILGGFLVLTLIAPFVWGDNPNALSAALLHAPSAEHWFGTDELGRDNFLQFVYGVRTSLTVGIAAAAATCFLGVLVGAYAGFSGGVVDLIVMRITEMFQVIPTFVLAAVIVAMWGPGLTRIVLVLALLSWPQVALVVRGEVLRIKKLDFVDAARCLGYGESYVLIFEVVPNALRPVLALGTLAVGQAILMEASLSFLGLGDPVLISWGKMLSIGQAYLFNAWWLSVFPGIAIFLTVLACNLLGDALSGRVNPKDTGR